MSVLRQLVQAHSEHLITREEYHHVRTLLLDKLEKTGTISGVDLDNFLNLKNVSNQNSTISKYDLSDFFITALGLCAASILAYILYS